MPGAASPARGGGLSMPKPAQAEPSMEEILASIRRIISDEESPKPVVPVAPKAAAVPTPSAPAPQPPAPAVVPFPAPTAADNDAGEILELSEDEIAPPQSFRPLPADDVA